MAAKPIKCDDIVGPVSGRASAVIAEAIEAIEFGVVIVAEDGFITFANATARALMRRGEGLRAGGGWLAGTSAETTTRLRNALKSGPRPASGASNGGTTILLERDAGRSSLFVYVMPLKSRIGNTLGSSAAALLVVIDPERHALPAFDAFADLYGLTGGEGRVLKEIVGGQGLIAAATNLRISVTTARTHLQRIFDKTGTNRQTELLCLFFRASLAGQVDER